MKCENEPQHAWQAARKLVSHSDSVCACSPVRKLHADWVSCCNHVENVMSVPHTHEAGTSWPFFNANLNLHCRSAVALYYQPTKMILVAIFTRK